MYRENHKYSDQSPSGKFHGIKDSPTHWLMPVLLLALREYNSYGYELMERATAFGFKAMNPGTVYRTLGQMEENGIVKSTWNTTNGGAARRMYSITDAGEAYLDFWAHALEQYRNNIDAFFRLYRGVVDATNEREDTERIGKASPKLSKREPFSA